MPKRDYPPDSIPSIVDTDEKYADDNFILRREIERVEGWFADAADNYFSKPKPSKALETKVQAWRDYLRELKAKEKEITDRREAIFNKQREELHKSNEDYGKAHRETLIAWANEQWDAGKTIRIRSRGYQGDFAPFVDQGPSKKSGRGLSSYVLTPKLVNAWRAQGKEFITTDEDGSLLIPTKTAKPSDLNPSRYYLRTAVTLYTDDGQDAFPISAGDFHHWKKAREAAGQPTTIKRKKAANTQLSMTGIKAKNGKGLAKEKDVTDAPVRGKERRTKGAGQGRKGGATKGVNVKIG